MNKIIMGLLILIIGVYTMVLILDKKVEKKISEHLEFCIDLNRYQVENMEILMENIKAIENGQKLDKDGKNK